MKLTLLALVTLSAMAAVSVNIDHWDQADATETNTGYPDKCDFKITFTSGADEMFDGAANATYAFTGHVFAGAAADVVFGTTDGWTALGVNYALTVDTDTTPYTLDSCTAGSTIFNGTDATTAGEASSANAKVGTCAEHADGITYDGTADTTVVVSVTGSEPLAYATAIGFKDIFAADYENPETAASATWAGRYIAGAAVDLLTSSADGETGAGEMTVTWTAVAAPTSARNLETSDSTASTGCTLLEAYFKAMSYSKELSVASLAAASAFAAFF